jgi:3-phosphoinositide dependent protein kinase-1
LDAQFHSKLTDFGTAKRLEQKDATENNQVERKNSFVGTAEYCSPEMLNDRECTPKSDVWSIGCIFYHLLSGRLPFRGVHEYQTFQKITNLDYFCPETFSKEAEALIESIFVKDPEQRVDIPSIKQNPLFKHIQWDELPNVDPPTIECPIEEESDEERELMNEFLTVQLQKDSITDSFPNLTMIRPDSVELKEPQSNN